MSLRIAPGLSLPLEAITQTFAILAKRRAGKSYTARRFTEQLFHAGAQVVIIDPKGDWWGIRSSADGKSPGLPIIILGGERGDAPLEVHSGELVAKLAVEERISILLDLSLFRKHEVNTFMTAFLETFYRLKAREQFRTPAMLVIDEADAIAPQRPMKGEERMLGAAEDIVRRGGQRGIGCLMISQRSAVINKNILTQIQVLIALRTIAPQDLDALNAWVDVHGTPDERKILMDSLPSLPIGDAWFWSPGWPSVTGIFERVHVLPIETFDSGATPKPGEKRIQPKNLADVDLEAIRKQMAGTIEKAKAEDPKELRKQLQEKDRRIRQLEQELAAAKSAPGWDKEIESLVRKEAASSAHRQYAPLIERLGATVESGRKVLEQLAAIHEEGASVSKFIGAITAPTAPRPQPIPTPRRLSVAPPRPPQPHSGAVLAGGERKILTALAQYPDGRTKTQVAILTGYAHSGGGFNNYLSALRTKGYLGGSGDRLLITEPGLAALGEYQPLPAGAELAGYWRLQLGKAERAALDALLDAYPRALSKEEVAQRAGYESSGGGFNNALSKLRTLELISGRGELRASEDLFG